MTSTGGDNRNAIILWLPLPDLAAALVPGLFALPSHRLQGRQSGSTLRRWERAPRLLHDRTTPRKRRDAFRESRPSGKRDRSEDAARLQIASGSTSTFRGTFFSALEVQKSSIRGRGRRGGSSAPAGRAPSPQLTRLDIANVRSGLTWLLALAVEAISAFGLFAITPRGSAGPAFSAQQGCGAAKPSWRLARPGHETSAVLVTARLLAPLGSEHEKHGRDHLFVGQKGGTGNRPSRAPSRWRRQKPRKQRPDRRSR